MQKLAWVDFRIQLLLAMIAGFIIQASFVASSIMLCCIHQSCLTNASSINTHSKTITKKLDHITFCMQFEIQLIINCKKSILLSVEEMKRKKK